MDTSDEWIRSRTGIGMRYIAVEETTTSMAVEAAEKALADAKISGCEIDLIIAGTISPDYIFPSLACEVQAAIGAKSATAFDLSAGCSGFLFALATADAYFRTGRYKHALVIGAETLSKMMNWANVTEEQLEREKTYPHFIRARSFMGILAICFEASCRKMEYPTKILYGDHDNMIDYSSVEDFFQKVSLSNICYERW